MEQQEDRGIDGSSCDNDAEGGGERYRATDRQRDEDVIHQWTSLSEPRLFGSERPLRADTASGLEPLLLTEGRSGAERLRVSRTARMSGAGDGRCCAGPPLRADTASGLEPLLL